MLNPASVTKLGKTWMLDSRNNKKPTPRKAVKLSFAHNISRWTHNLRPVVSLSAVQRSTHFSFQRASWVKSWNMTVSFKLSVLRRYIKRRLSYNTIGQILACSAGVFQTRGCTFSYKAAILDLVTVEDSGEEIFSEGGVGPTLTRQPLSTNPPLPIKHPRWRQRKPDILFSVLLQTNACTAG